ncbi:DNA-binding storekeeper protein-relatedtranscriptional regulator, partial [Striga asiatica]
MAKAREPVSSGTSSGEEETENSSSEEIGSEPEQIRKTSPPPAAAKKPHTPSAIIPAQDSESESDRKASKKSKPKKSRARSKARKRAVEEVKGTEPTVTMKSKKSKKAEPEKKQPFQRIWSEADQITILNKILQFRAEKNSDLNENFDAFFEFIKKNLQIEATRAQLRDKISRMKKKYTNNKRKEHDGKGRTFTSQHEREAYDLSEKVWGAEKENANGSGAEKENGNGSGSEKENPNGSGAEKENPNGSGTEKENAAGEKENMVEKGNGSGSERFVWMSESLLRGSGDVPAVEDKEGKMGNKEDDEALENLEIEEMKVPGAIDGVHAAREPVSSGISSGEEETENSSSEEIGSEPSPPPAAATKPQPKTPSAIIPAQDSESESDRKARKKSKSKKSRARSTRKRAVEEVKGTEPTVTKKSKNSKKAREPVEETDDSSSEDIGSEPEQIRKTSPPPAAASASAARSRRKRAVEEDKGTEPAVTKKSKKSKKAEPEKKQPFQRIWSEADEITILNGILQFRAQKKSDLNENFDAFFEFIKKNLQIEATRSQLRDKISRMKKKYTNNKRKEHDGKGRTFTSQHEREAYDLSEKVWGAEKENGNGSGSEKENPNG